jgi:hypothetical protein
MSGRGELFNAGVGVYSQAALAEARIDSVDKLQWHSPLCGLVTAQKLSDARYFAVFAFDDGA